MLTYVQQANADNDDMNKGIVRTVMAKDQMALLLPSKAMDSVVHTYATELLSFDQTKLTGFYDMSNSIIQNESQPFESKTVELTSMIGQVELNKFLSLQGSAYNDALMQQVSATSRSLGIRYSNAIVRGNANVGFKVADVWNSGHEALLKSVLSTTDYAKVDTNAERVASVSLLIGNQTAGHKNFAGSLTTGTGTSEALTSHGVDVLEAASRARNSIKGFDGLDKFLDGSGNNLTGTATINSHTATSADLIRRLDYFISRVSARGGEVDFIMANNRFKDRFNAAIIELGSFTTPTIVKNSSGMSMEIMSYRGIPILTNNYCGQDAATVVNTSLAGGNLIPSTTETDTVYLGTFDSGSGDGICGLHAREGSGINLEKIGTHQSKDVEIHRLTMRVGFVSYSELGLVKGLI